MAGESNLVRFQNNTREPKTIRTTPLLGMMSKFLDIEVGEIVELPYEQGIALGLTPVPKAPEQKAPQKPDVKTPDAKGEDKK
jgi:hypothetical protein